jgi:TolA-binding protein
VSDNVTPIAPISRCSGCGAEVLHEQRFDPTKHDARCPQPEIRMRRAEAQIEQLNEIIMQLAGQGNDLVTNQIDLNNRLKVLEAR